MDKTVERIGQKSLQKITIGKSVFIKSYDTIVACTYRGKAYVRDTWRSSTTSEHINLMGYKNATKRSNEYLKETFDRVENKYFQSIRS
jgi:hypothetical protein